MLGTKGKFVLGSLVLLIDIVTQRIRVVERRLGMLSHWDNVGSLLRRLGMTLVFICKDGL